MKAYLKALLDRASSASSMRFVLIFSYLFVVLITFIVWAVLSSTKQAIQDIPMGLITFAGIVLGYATGGKYLEKREETKQNGCKDEHRE